MCLVCRRNATMLSAFCIATAAFQMPVSRVGMSRVDTPMMNSIEKQSSRWNQKFWERPDFKEKQDDEGKATAAETNLSYIYGTKDPDGGNKGAFWKNPEWIAKQKAASEANKGKWMAGTGQANWGETGGVPAPPTTSTGLPGWK